MPESTLTPREIWPRCPELRFAQLPSGRVAYVESGRGPAVVLIHGFGDQFVTWRHQVPELARGGRVIALDLPGYGLSEKPPLAYRPRFFVETLGHFLDAVNAGPAALVGSSMGAAVSLGLAVTQPERVTSLALLGPTTPGAMPTGRAFDALFWALRWPGLLKILLRAAPRAATRLTLLEAVEDDGLIDAALVAYYHRLTRQPGFVDAYVSTAFHWREWTELRPRMGAITVPTLLLWGSTDAVHPIRQSGLLRTLIPAARFLPMPCGHLPQIERPHDVTAALRELLGTRGQ